MNKDKRNNIQLLGTLNNADESGIIANASQIYDANENKSTQDVSKEHTERIKTLEDKENELIAAVGTGGSVDTRITNAVNVEKTRAEGAESTLDGKITAEQTRAANAENALDGRVDTLEEAVGTGGSVDSKIASAVATETSRAQEAEANRYTKNETYTKEEVNNLITTPNQEYVSVTATDQTTAVTDVLPAIGLANTVYRVGSWDGSQYDVTKYSEYAWNGKDYVHLSTKTGETSAASDVTYNHNDSKLDATNVQQAVDEVYKKSTEQGKTLAEKINNNTTANKVLKQYSNIDLTDGYYNSDGTSITYTPAPSWCCIKFNVSDYVGKILSISNSINKDHSGWIDSDGTITRISLDSNRQTIIPKSAVTVFISIPTNRLFATIDIIEAITLSEALDNKADLDSVLPSYQEIKTKSTDVRNGYLTPSGNVGNRGYYIKVDCSSYIGDKAIFQPACGDATLTGFILDDGTIKSLSVSKTDKFSSIVPANAKYAVENYTADSDESKRHITFLHKVSADDLMTQETADKRYINIEILKSELKTTESDLIIGYTNSSGYTTTHSGHHSLKIDVSKYQGAACVINKPFVYGSVSTTGYENTSGTKKQIEVVDGVVNNIVIPDDAVTLWVTFMDSKTPIEEQYVTIIKYDTDLSSKTYVNTSVKTALDSAKEYADEKLVDIGISKLPPSTLWYVMGDSITARGLTVGVGNKYYEFIASRNNLTYGEEVVSIANDGATITYRSSGYGGSQLSKISSIPTNATLITIMLGINDFQLGTIELGNLYNGSDFIDVPSTIEECTTFAKAEVYLIYNLIKRCPKATIAQILPLRRSGMNKNALGNTIDEFWDVIEKTCQHFSIPVIRLGAESSLLNNEVGGSGFFADVVHLNKAGHLVASYYIENHLALLVPTKQTVEVSTLSGNIIDGSGASVDISLIFTSASGAVITTAAGYGGAYSAELDNGVAYKITASGYSVSPSSITISEATTQDMTVTKS